MFLDIQYLTTNQLIKNASKIVGDDRIRKLASQKAKDMQKDLMILKNLNNKGSDERSEER
jgi:hypothetical protein